MTTVFVAGSIKIKNLHAKVVERLQGIIDSGLAIIVGDADGADSAIQNELANRSYENVTIYCSGHQPRNNVGSWPVQAVETIAEPGTRAYYTAKDRKMALDADYGLMIWDSKSTGTLTNVIELIRHGKKSVIFVNKSKHFMNVQSGADLPRLLDVMSEDARFKADEKLGLNRIIASLTNEQLGLGL